MTKTYTLSSGTQVKVTAKNKRVSNHWGHLHYAYTIVIDVDGDTYKTTFHDSGMNYSRGVSYPKDLINSAVNCTMLDADSYDHNPTLEEFLDEYGYDWEDENGYKAFAGCREAYERISRMLTLDEQNELVEMTD